MLNNFVFPPDNATALHVAAYYNNISALALLLRNKVKCPFLSTKYCHLANSLFFLYLFICDVYLPGITRGHSQLNGNHAYLSVGEATPKAKIFNLMIWVWGGEYEQGNIYVALFCHIYKLLLQPDTPLSHSKLSATFQKVNNDQGLCNILPWKEQRKPIQVTNKFIWYLSISMYPVVGQFCGPHSAL